MADRPIAWTALTSGARVVTADGEELGKVDEVVGDLGSGIFSGLNVSTGLLGSDLFVAAEHVHEITEDSVLLHLTSRQAQSELSSPD